MPNRHIITGQKIDPAKLQRAKALRRNMTPAEKRLWTALRANRLQGFHFRRQQIIDGFIVDFYCHAAGLVVEVDGPVHDQQADYDAERDRALSTRGLRTLRVRNSEVMQDLKGVLARIETACKEKLENTPPPRAEKGPRENSPPRAGKGPARDGPGHHEFPTPLPASGRGRGRGPMILLNFSHPLTDNHLTQIETLTGQAVAEVRHVLAQLDHQQPFVSQVQALAEACQLTPQEWQTTPLLVVPPSLNFIAVVLLAELHGRMGYFPPVVRLRPVTGSTPTCYEVAEVINLQQVRDDARTRRQEE